MKATLKNTVENVYEINNNGEFSGKTKKLVKNSNAYSKSNVLSLKNSKYDSITEEPTMMSNKSHIIEENYPIKSSFSIWNAIAILLIIFIVIMVTIIFVFKEKIMEFAKSYIQGAANNEESNKNIMELQNRISDLEEKQNSLKKQNQKQKQIKKKRLRQNHSNLMTQNSKSRVMDTVILAMIMVCANALLFMKEISAYPANNFQEWINAWFPKCLLRFYHNMEFLVLKIKYFYHL